MATFEVISSSAFCKIAFLIEEKTAMLIHQIQNPLLGNNLYKDLLSVILRIVID